MLEGYIYSRKRKEIIHTVGNEIYELFPQHLNPQE